MQVRMGLGKTERETDLSIGLQQPGLVWAKARSQNSVWSLVWEAAAQRLCWKALPSGCLGRKLDWEHRAARTQTRYSQVGCDHFSGAAETTMPIISLRKFIYHIIPVSVRGSWGTYFPAAGLSELRGMPGTVLLYLKFRARECDFLPPPGN